MSAIPPTLIQNHTNAQSLPNKSTNNRTLSTTTSFTSMKLNSTHLNNKRKLIQTQHPPLSVTSPQPPHKDTLDRRMKKFCDNDFYLNLVNKAINSTHKSPIPKHTKPSPSPPSPYPHKQINS